MALSIDRATSVITINQADLNLISGTLYELPTEDVFRTQVNSLMASEEGIVFVDPIDHNTEYTVTGVTYARKIEVINGYSVTFENLTYSVRLAQSNNNLFDVDGGILNPNSVTVIGQNSAGLIVVTSAPKKNVALPNFEFVMVLASDHVTGATGLSITSQRSRDAEALGATDNTATEVSDGIYRINLSADDMNGDQVTLRFSAATADDRIITIITA